MVTRFGGGCWPGGAGAGRAGEVEVAVGAQHEALDLGALALLARRLVAQLHRHCRAQRHLFTQLTQPSVSKVSTVYLYPRSNSWRKSRALPSSTMSPLVQRLYQW